MRSIGDRATSPKILVEGEGDAALARPKPKNRERRSRKQGYVSVDLEPKAMTTRMRVVSDVTDLRAVESGKPGMEEARGGLA
jgi:hypothetical protein